MTAEEVDPGTQSAHLADAMGLGWGESFFSSFPTASSGDTVLEEVVTEWNEGTSTGVPADEFRQVFRNYPSGVAVVTAVVDGNPAAMTATSVISVSAEPPVLVLSLSALSSASAIILLASSVVVHLLDADDLDLAKLCSTSGVNRFAEEDTWTLLPTGEPLFHTCRTWIRGDIIGRMLVGGSTVVAVKAMETRSDDEAEPGVGPLVYHARRWHTLSERSELAP
ncbi:MAG: flavin reductase-like protein [Aeromicrobium sp.]|nr:flavin reductase-like protein [Aeromicrobium sp.]